MPIKNLGQKLLFSLLLAILVMAGFMFYTDLQALGLAFRRFNWWMILPVLLMTALNLGARFIKWEYYLRLLDIREVSLDNSLAIFLANYLLILTPGKVGGFLKSYFLKQTNGIPISHSMPIIIAERLTDGLGMLLLTTAALVAYPAAWPIVILVLVGMLALIAIIQIRPLALRLLHLGEQLPLIKRFAITFHHLYESAYGLLQPKPLFLTTLLGGLARMTEGFALYFILLGLEIENSYTLLEQSVFISALSNIIGVVVMMPGGLGGTESSMAGLLDYFVGLDPASATAATLLARLGSLWVPASLGLLGLVIKRKVLLQK